MAAAWEISIVSEKPISVELLNLIIKEYEVTDSHNQSIPDYSGSVVKTNFYAIYNESGECMFFS